MYEMQNNKHYKRLHMKAQRDFFDSGSAKTSSLAKTPSTRDTSYDHVSLHSDCQQRMRRKPYIGTRAIIIRLSYVLIYIHIILLTIIVVDAYLSNHFSCNKWPKFCRRAGVTSER